MKCFLKVINSQSEFGFGLEWKWIWPKNVLKELLYIQILILY